MEEQDSFTVKDKRRFKEGTEEVKEAPGTQSYTPLEINFSSFIFSLGRSAFVHLGEEPDPVSGKKEVSLSMAKETIDIIALLEEKTKGNLTQEEDHLLKNILYALRMRYVELAAKKP